MYFKHGMFYRSSGLVFIPFVMTVSKIVYISGKWITILVLGGRLVTTTDG